jgi:hypothetical protein
LLIRQKLYPTHRGVSFVNYSSGASYLDAPGP